MICRSFLKSISVHTKTGKLRQNHDREAGL